MRSSLPTLLTFTLGLCVACGGDTGDTDDTASTGDASTGDTSDTNEPTTGEPVDLNDRDLGDSASPACVKAQSLAGDFITAGASGNASAAGTAYLGTDLQTHVQGLDSKNGRTDDAAITDWINDGSETALTAATARLQVAYLEEMRANFTAVETGAEDKYNAWDDAYCVWQATVRTLAEEADQVTWHSFSETIVADIDGALRDGHDALSGEPPNTAGDDWRIPPNKQIAEKSLFRVIQRIIIELANKAKNDADPIAARRALELFAAVEGRLAERNTPGIQKIIDAFSGDPAAIDPDDILVQLDIAFAKRTRRYTSQAIEDDEIGVPSGYKGAVEGHVYGLLIVPGMIAKLGDSFNANAYTGEWAGYAELVRTGMDVATIEAVSQRLTDMTCAYQTALGVAECSGNSDETE